MKALLGALLLLIATTAYSDELADRIAAIPNPKVSGGWVADPVGVIAARRADINQLITSLEKSTSAEIAVVVLPTIGQLVPKDFAVALVKRWGIGKAGKDNGVLVLHILDQRRIEIETGYGAEGILPDVKARWIAAEIAAPFFKQDSFADGHYEVVRALVRAIEQPDISHSNLISPLVTQPGATTNELPRSGERDAISLKYASTSTRVFQGIWHSVWTPIVLVVLGLMVFFGVSLSNWRRSMGKEPYAQYHLLQSGLSRLQYLAALPIAASALVFETSRASTFFSPIPVLAAILFFTFRQRSKTLQALRDAPRTCQCGKIMRRLSEQQDDAYIEKGNVAEESIGSVDYDVWLCECGKSAIESYKGKTAAEVCTQCHYRTYRVTDSRVLAAATHSSTGLREITSECANCNYKKVENFVIPIVASSSNHASGGSSGRSGGSFGGGRSGGGGAGSSY